MKRALFLAFLVCYAWQSVGVSQTLNFGSGSTTGVYFPVATGIAKIINDANLPFKINVRPTLGSVFNVTALGSGELQMALVQNDIAFYAFNGGGIATFEGKPVKNMGSLGAIYPETIHILARTAVGIADVADLKGKRVVVGEAGSGTEQNARQILEAFNLSFGDLGQVLRVSLDQAVSLMQNGQADALFFTGGLGNAGITQIARSTGVRLLAVDTNNVRTLIRRYPFYIETLVPSGTYPGIEVTTATVALQAVLAVSLNVPADTVYAMAKTLFDSPDFKKIHPNLERFDLRRAIRALPMPLHPGAERFYREKGVLR